MSAVTSKSSLRNTNGVAKRAMMSLARCHGSGGAVAATVAAAALQAGKAWTDLDLVFPRLGFCKHWGKPQDQNQIRKALKRAAHRAGIGHVRPHDLRHTCASLLISEGLNIKQVSSHLRHSSVGITLDTYGHIYPADRNEVAYAMDRILGIAGNG